ncbi:amidohydrolase family protein [Pseudoroseomonas wenyumeiae]
MRDSGLRGRFYYGHPNDLPKDKLMDLPGLEALAKEIKGDGLVSSSRRTRAGPLAGGDLAPGMGGGTGPEPADLHPCCLQQGGGAERRDQGHGGRQLPGPRCAAHPPHPGQRRRPAPGGRWWLPVGLCPWTEMQVGFGLPPVARLQKQGLPIGLGLDNLALAGNADVFAMMKLTADLAAASAGEQGTLTERQVLEWATIGGARSIGMEEQIGSLTPGKRADLIMVRMDAVNTTPAPRPDITLVRAAQPANISLVMIEGRIHKRGGRLVGHDTRKLLRDAGGAFSRLQKEAGI